MHTRTHTHTHTHTMGTMILSGGCESGEHAFWRSMLIVCEHVCVVVFALFEFVCVCVYMFQVCLCVTCIYISVYMCVCIDVDICLCVHERETVLQLEWLTNTVQSF